MSAHTPWVQVFDELLSILDDRASHPQRMCDGYTQRLRHLWLLAATERDKERGPEAPLSMETYEGWKGSDS
jgi:hypothetical protein